MRARWPATLAFASAARRDSHFLALIAAVRSGRDTAENIARAYARRHAARTRLAELIEDVSLAPAGSGEQLALTAGLGTISAFVTAEVPAGLPRYAIQERTYRRHQRGATCILRRGAGLCIACGATPSKAGSQRGRWSGYLDYCSLHGKTEYERRRDREAIDDVLNELAADHPGISRATARRHHRSQ